MTLSNAGVGPRHASSSTVVEHRDVGAQRRELAEEQRLGPLARAASRPAPRPARRSRSTAGSRPGIASRWPNRGQHGRRPTSRPSPAAREAVGASRRPAPGSRESTPAARRTSRPRRPRRAVVRARRSSCTTRVPRTHCARSLSGVQMMHPLDARIGGGLRRGGRQRVVGLELHHRPDVTPQRRQAPPRAAGTARSRSGSMPSPVL